MNGIIANNSNLLNSLDIAKFRAPLPKIQTRQAGSQLRGVWGRPGLPSGVGWQSVAISPVDN